MKNKCDNCGAELEEYTCSRTDETKAIPHRKSQCLTILRTRTEVAETTIAEAWSKLTGWDAIRLKNGSHEASKDPNAALLSAVSHEIHRREVAEREHATDLVQIEHLKVLANQEPLRKENDDLRAMLASEKQAREVEREALEADLDEARTQLVTVGGERENWYSAYQDERGECVDVKNANATLRDFVRWAAETGQVTKGAAELVLKQASAPQEICTVCDGNGEIAHDVTCAACHGRGVPAPEPRGEVKIDPRPFCVICNKRWVPLEGTDATLVPCGECRTGADEVKQADTWISEWEGIVDGYPIDVRASLAALLSNTRVKAIEACATVCDEFSMGSKLQMGEREVLGIAADKCRALQYPVKDAKR